MGAENKFKYSIIAVLLLALIFLSGCSLDYELCFLIEDNNDVLDGEVFLNGESIGSSSNGCIMVPQDSLSAGKLTLETEYRGREHEILMAVEEKDLDAAGVDYFITLSELDQYPMTFLVEGTETTVDGDVYLNSKLLGKTENGDLTVDINDLFPGTITLETEYNGETYEVQFEFTKEDLGYSGMDFFVQKDYIDYIEFDASALDNEKIESKALSLINSRRKREGLKELTLSSKVSDSARNYAERVADPDFKPADQKSALEKFEDDNIFSFYADGLSHGGELSADSDENAIAKQIVDAWFDDGWAEEALLEEYSHIGIGVYLENKIFVGIAFLSFEEVHVNSSMKHDQCGGMVYLYDENLPFEDDIKIRFKLDSTEKISAYIITDEEEQENCIKRKQISAIKSYKFVKNIDDEIVIPKGAGLMLTTGSHNADYSYTVEYLSWG